MKIAIASDHAGIEVREGLLRFLKDAGHEVEDMGPFSTDRVDYPDYAVKACKRVSGGVCAVLICGTGIGMAMSDPTARNVVFVPGCAARSPDNRMPPLIT